MRSEIPAMAATVFICAAVSISHASAYSSVVTVASPQPTSAQTVIILTAEGTRAIALYRTLAANITIFHAMNGIPAVGTGGTIPNEWHRQSHVAT
jgi:hypothetical protein